MDQQAEGGGGAQQPLPRAAIDHRADHAERDQPRDALHALRKPDEAPDLPGLAQAAVQADGKHLGRFLAFGIQHVEGVAQVLEERLAMGEALGQGEAHVVGVQSIGHHQVGRARLRSPVGEVVCVAVGVVEEALLHAETFPNMRQEYYLFK